MNAIFFHFDCTVIYGKQCPCTVLLNDEMYAKFTYPLRDYLSFQLFHQCTEPVPWFRLGGSSYV